MAVDRFAQKKKAVTGTTFADLQTSEGLIALAKSKGLSDEIDDVTKENQLSVLQRLSAGLGAFNPTEAVIRSREGSDNLLMAYTKTVRDGIFSALTGNDLGEQSKRRYFGDLVKELGVKNKVAQVGIGFIGDILLDPSTYFGGAVVRGALNMAKFTGKTAFKGMEKLTPEAAERLAESGVKLKEVGVELFSFGKGASQETIERYMQFKRKKAEIKEASLTKAKGFGSGTLTDEQVEAGLSYMDKGKRAQLSFQELKNRQFIDDFQKRFPEMKSIKLEKDFRKILSEQNPEEWVKMTAREQELAIRAAMDEQTIRTLERINVTIPDKIGRLQELRDKLAKPWLDEDAGLLQMKQTLAQLRKELGLGAKKKVGKVFKATDEEFNHAILNALSSQKDKYRNIILGLEKRVKKIEEISVSKEGIKTGTKKSSEIKSHIVQIDKDILKLTNEMGTKTHLLENALASKQIARDIIERAFKKGDFSTLPTDVATALKLGSGYISKEERIRRRAAGLPEYTDIEKAIHKELERNKDRIRKSGAADTYFTYAPSVRELTDVQRIRGVFEGAKYSGLRNEGWTKEYKAILKEEELQKDRFLFARLDEQIATNNLTQDFFQRTIKLIGKPTEAFKNELEAKTAGYRMLKTHGTIGKELGYIPEKEWKFLDSQMGDNFPAIDALAKALGFDVMNSLFKRWVTGPFASFHVRNFFSGFAQNYEEIGYQAFSPKAIANGFRITHKISQGAFLPMKAMTARGLVNIPKKELKRFKTFGDETIELGGKTYHLDELTTALQNKFKHSTFYTNDYNSLTRDAEILSDAGAWSKEVMRKWGRNIIDVKRRGAGQIEALLGQENPLLTSARVIGQFTEINQKANAMLAALMKGHTLDEALGIAEKAGFNYAKLTGFESHVMRRLMPFYSFTRNNIALQLRTLGKNPQRINHIIRSIENVQNIWEQDLTEEEQENLPTYLKEYLSFQAGRTNEGIPIFVRNFGTPLEAFTNLVKTSADGKTTWERTFLSTLSMVAPYIKAPFELAIGKDSFRQRDIKEVYNAKEYRDAPQILKDFLHLREIEKTSATGEKYMVYPADPKRLLVLRSFFTSRGFTYVSNIFNGDIPAALRLMNSITGIQSSEINTDFYGNLTERQRYEELSAILRRNGVGAEFNKFFIPKNK